MTVILVLYSAATAPPRRPAYLSRRYNSW